MMSLSCNVFRIGGWRAGWRFFIRRDHCIRLIRKYTDFAVHSVDGDCDVAVMSAIFDESVFPGGVFDGVYGDTLAIFARRLHLCPRLACLDQGLDSPSLGSIQAVTNVLAVRALGRCTRVP